EKWGKYSTVSLFARGISYSLFGVMSGARQGLGRAGIYPDERFLKLQRQLGRCLFQSAGLPLVQLPLKLADPFF
ncbi:MAG TPA: hypothetical protein PLG20_08680, partial [Candidatus Syntrophosphaera sp.]|nr:hypothetical protein [Candidatus Syntrophosphaera sp.]